MIKVICFDLFSTLVDVGSVPLTVGRMTADIFGLESAHWNALSFSAHHEICRPTNASDVIRTLIHSHNPDISEELIQQDVLDGIRHLKAQGYTLILVSNASTAEVQRWSDSPLADYFEHSIFSCAVGLKKPDRAIYQHVCELVPARPAECLFVGDGGSDELIGAREFGMQTLLMTRFLENNTASRRNLYARVIDGEVDSTMAVFKWLARQ